MIRFSLVFAVAALPVSLAAQAPERASFYLVVHGAEKTDTVVAERVARTSTELSGELLDRARGGRIAYVASLTPAALVSRLETKTYRSAADTVPMSASLSFDGDSVIARMGSAEPAHVPSPPEALAVINPSAAFIEQMVRRAIAIGADTSGIPLFIAGAPQAVTLIARRIARDSLTLSYAGVVMRVAISPEGRLLGGALPDQHVTIERGPAVETLTMATVDYGAPADAPYTAEEVVIRTPAGLRLTGTLTIPRARRTGRAPAVVTITGSGAQDRDGHPAGFGDYRPFREIADTLGRRGMAVLRLDDRGVNGSDPGPAGATSRDLADDIRAAVAFLRARPEIDGARVGIVGHSEGGLIAPMVAASDSTLRAIVLMAGFASPGREIIASQQMYVVDTVAHLTGDQRSAALAQYRRATDSLARVVPWWNELLAYDPAPTARRVTASVLILHGETDHQVPLPEAEKLAGAFRAGASRSVTVRTFPATNHLFVADATGSFDYAKLSSLRVRREVLGAIADWLSTEFR
jgi:dipeptidyl aminopeptidase/acylaminoacyl peptidase